MKTIFSKRFMAPLAVMILGGAGAFVTASMSTLSTVAEKPGYHFVSMEEPCHQEEEVRCTTDQTGVICTYGSDQLYGKINDASEGPCNLPLRKVLD